MFKIQGADQKEYGPVTTETMHQWITERRVDGRTLVQAEGTTGWRPLAEFEELAAFLVAGPRPPPQASASPAKTSGMAIASLVCGVMGCLGITALIGLVLGIVAQIKISRSGGRLKGSGLAIAGMCISGVMLLFGIPVLAGLFLPALAKAKGRAQTINCVSNMKQLALAVRMYANDNKDTFPPADTWCDAIQTYGAGAKAFRCSADTTGQRATYALNEKIAGRKEGEVDPRTVMLFEIEGGWNVSGGPEKAMPRSRHAPRVVVAFADGSVQQLPDSALNSLRWDP